MSSPSTNITSVLKETRTFAPSAAFVAQANIKSLAEYEKLWKRAADDPDGFWGEQAESLAWFKKWNTVLEWNEPFSKWFVGGKINACYNCLDRHLDGPRKNKAAIIWEGEPGDSRVLRYQDLHREVCQFANVLKKLGIKSGDKVTLYMPMVPELAIAMLACARIGAPHSVVFGGFSADALRDRINDCQSKLLVTADGGYRRGTVIGLKKIADEALPGTTTVQKVVVFKRLPSSDATMQEGRDVWWHDVVKEQPGDCPAEPLDSEDMLYLLYTSGTTGKPKGILHTTGGYMTGVYATFKWIFDSKEEDIFWCTADI